MQHGPSIICLHLLESLVALSHDSSELRLPLPIVTLNERSPIEPCSPTIQSLHPSTSRVLDRFSPSGGDIFLSSRD